MTSVTKNDLKLNKRGKINSYSKKNEKNDKNVVFFAAINRHRKEYLNSMFR